MINVSQQLARRPLVFVFVALLVGVLLQRCWPCPLWFSTAVAGTSLAAAGLLGFGGRPAMIALLVAAMATGAARLAAHLTFAHDDIGRWATAVEQPVVVQGVALGAARLTTAGLGRGDGSWWLLEATSLRDLNQWRPVSGRIRVTAGFRAEIRRGDRLQLWGRLSRPTEPGNPGQQDFRQRRWDERITGSLRIAQPDHHRRIGAPAWSAGDVAAWLDRLRGGALTTLQARIAGRHARLGGGHGLGATGTVVAAAPETFRRAGVMHLLAVSGMHVGMLLLGVWSGLRILGASRRVTFTAVAISGVLYAAVADSGAPVWRAAVLTLLVAAARGGGRPFCSLHGLAAAAVVLLLWDPTQVFHLGAQLSFLALTALILGAGRPKSDDPLDRVRLAARPWWWRWGTLLVEQSRFAITASFRVWLATAPLVAHSFHYLSPWGVALAPLLWPPAAAALLAALVLVVGSWCPPIAWLASGVAHYSFVAMWRLTAAAASLGGWWLSGPAVWWVVVWHVLLFVWVICDSLRLITRRALWIWLAVGVLAECSTPGPDEVHWSCTALDVGHGSAILVRAADGKCMLVDAGRLGNAWPALDAVSQSLWRMKVREIDILAITHADADHLNAVAGLLQRFRVKRLIGPTQMFRRGPPAIQRILAEARRQGATIEAQARGRVGAWAA